MRNAWRLYAECFEHKAAKAAFNALLPGVLDAAVLTEMQFRCMTTSTCRAAAVPGGKLQARFAKPVADCNRIFCNGWSLSRYDENRAVLQPAASPQQTLSCHSL